MCWWFSYHGIEKQHKGLIYFNCQHKIILDLNPLDIVVLELAPYFGYFFPSALHQISLPKMIDLQAHSVTQCHTKCHNKIQFVTYNQTSLTTPLSLSLGLCAMSTLATEASSTSWSVKDTVETISTGGTGALTVRLPRSSPSDVSIIKRPVQSWGNRALVRV